MYFEIKYQNLNNYNIDKVYFKSKSKQEAENDFYMYNGEHYDILNIKRISKKELIKRGDLWIIKEENK